MARLFPESRAAIWRDADPRGFKRNEIVVGTGEAEDRATHCIRIDRGGLLRPKLSNTPRR